MSEMLLEPVAPRRRDRPRARGRARGDRDVRGRAAGPRPRRARRGRLRRPSARPARPRRGGGDRRVPRDEIAAYHDDRYTAPNIVVGAAGHVEHAEIVELAAAHLSPGRGRHERRRQAAASPTRRRASASREGDRAVPHLLRRARDPARRRPPLRPRRARRDLRGLQLLAALPRDPREARARLRRRLLHRAVRRPRHGRHVRRHPRGERRRGLRDHRPRAGRASRRRRQRRGAGAGQGARQGPHGARHGVDAAPACRRLARALLFDVPLLSLDEMLAARRRGHRATTWPRSPASSTTRSGLSAACIGPSRGALPRRRAASGRPTALAA